MPELPRAQQVLPSRPVSTAGGTGAGSPPPAGQAAPALPRAQAESLLASLKGVSLAGPAASRPAPAPAPDGAPAFSPNGASAVRANGASAASPNGASAGRGPQHAAQAGPTARGGTEAPSADGRRDPRSDDILPVAAKKFFSLRLR